MGWAWPRRGVRVIAGPPEVATRRVRTLQLGVFLLYNAFRRACVFVCVLYLEYSCVVLFQHVGKVGGGPTHSLYLCVPGFTLISS